MRDKPDFIGDPSGRVYDIRHLKNPQTQYSEQDYKTQYAAYLNKIEADNEVYKKFADDFNNRISQQTASIFLPIGVLIMIVIIALRLLLK